MAPSRRPPKRADWRHSVELLLAVFHSCPRDGARRQRHGEQEPRVKMQALRHGSGRCRGGCGGRAWRWRACRWVAAGGGAGRRGHMRSEGVSVGRRKNIRRNKERYHDHFIFLCIFLNRGHSIFIARTEIKCQIRENKRRNRGEGDHRRGKRGGYRP